MKMIYRFANLVLPVCACFAFSLDAKPTVEQKIMFSNNKCISKGGVGVVGKGLHVILTDDVNKLKLGPGLWWTGKKAGLAEVIFVFRGQAIQKQDLPDDFDLSKSIIISFEGDKVRFFDFEKMSGGFYSRI